MNRFLITACGRSGTKFLADLMNQSKIWTVNHEPDAQWYQRKRITQETRPLLQLASYSRFANTIYYGEVNSLMRLLIIPKKNSNVKRVNDFPVDKKGIILRNPYELFLSTINRRNSEKWDECLYNLENDLDIIEWCVKQKFRKIRFSKMVSDTVYTQELLRDFGINDVEITSKMLQVKKNHTEEKIVTIDDLNSTQKGILNSISSRFLERHEV